MACFCFNDDEASVFEGFQYFSSDKSMLDTYTPSSSRLPWRSIYFYKYIYIYICVHVCSYIYSIQIVICSFIYIYIFIHIYIYPYLYLSMYLHTHMPTVRSEVADGPRTGGACRWTVIYRPLPLVICKGIYHISGV
jgi:hypothetical protein